MRSELFSAGLRAGRVGLGGRGGLVGADAEGLGAAE
jgi:hypothetical protein